MVSLHPETHDMAKSVLGCKWVQSTELDCNEQVVLQLACVGSWAGITYLNYTVLMSPNKDKAAVHCCNHALSTLVMLLTQNVFLILSSLQSIVCLYLGLSRSLVHPALAEFIACGPLQFLVCQIRERKERFTWVDPGNLENNTLLSDRPKKSWQECHFNNLEKIETPPEKSNYPMQVNGADRARVGGGDDDAKLEQLQ